MTYYHELTPGSNLIEDLARDAARALAVLDLGQRLLQQVRQAFAHTKTIRLTGPGELGLAVDLQKAFQSSPEPKLGCNSVRVAAPPIVALVSILTRAEARVQRYLIGSSKRFCLGRPDTSLDASDESMPILSQRASRTPGFPHWEHLVIR